CALPIQLAGLRDPVLLGRRRLGEAAFRTEIARRPPIAAQAALFDSIAAVEAGLTRIGGRIYAFLSSSSFGSSTLARASLAGQYADARAAGGPLERLKEIAERAAAIANRPAALERLLARADNLAARLARVRFDVYGKTLPPDATFTLRLADGVVRGYPYNGTRAVPFTTFYGMYDRYAAAGGQAPWSLPRRWQRPPAGLDLATPLDLVSTNDIIGGNSGSPLLNRSLELVGLIF